MVKYIMELFKRIFIGLLFLIGMILASIGISIVGIFIIIGLMGCITFAWGLLGFSAPVFSSAILIFGLPAVLIYAWKIGKK